MKIISLQAENYKRLKAVSITPDGNMVIIAGRNKQGKTSTLDAIWAALEGAAAGKENPEPIRAGEKTAKITLDLGDMIVTRKWTDNSKTYLQVEGKDGAKYSSPQAILDAMIGKLSFDPLSFARLKGQDQVKALLQVVDIGIDPAKIEAERKALYEQRTDLNREVKRLEGQLAGMVKPTAETPTEEVSAAEILAELQAAQHSQTLHEQRQECIRRTVDHYKELKDRIGKIDQEVTALLEEKEQTEKDVGSVKDIHAMVVAAAKEFQAPDLEAIQAKLANIEQTNASARVGKDYRRVADELAAEKKGSEVKTAEINALDKKKADAIAAAKMPVEGLSFDADGLIYQGVPFSQAAESEKLRVSIGMAIAMNPTIRVIRIKDGSLLDSDNMALIEQMATEHDFQCWVERVDDSGKIGITIEDGEVKGA